MTLRLAAALSLGLGSGWAQPTCRFQAGFRSIADQIPEVVGQCLADEHTDAATGNTEQRTTAWHGNGGLMVWRAADNWTAFTDGARTWVNGPFGLQVRPNEQRFFWESDGAPGLAPPGTIPGPESPASPAGPGRPAGPSEPRAPTLPLAGPAAGP